MKKQEAAELLKAEACKDNQKALLCRGVRKVDAEQWRRLAQALEMGAQSLENQP